MKRKCTTNMEKKLKKDRLCRSVLKDLKHFELGYYLENINNQNRLKMFRTQKDQ